ncbi:MAG TPA: acyl-CoA dehydrogenase family protein [Spirochaetota bacterium]|nr:acyl-CoA/acyl-ACP dehydrogenase [Spirochaetota bacterium]HOD14490.1 acyl-CoA dehydrogenase family protein [Spirochaetota bacterium]HPG50493.1 acyl-CoA dehydrogenase family protein [Spirochaetota bacterium]HPN11842.1 acyl-CoA dehydrogenase family protein [Spirochaetota bacterium]HQL81245.1 acyl-CoA dehydrogenase family protein [Spirochaetota bacterium]
MKPLRIGRKEKLHLLEQGPKIWEAFNGLECQHRLAKSTHKDVKKAIAIARKFNNEVIRPIYLEMDLKCMEDHDYLAWDFLKKAGEWGLFSLFIPKIFGGSGLNFLGMYPFIEEIASVCSGLGHIIFVHYLGLATLFPSFNSKILNKVLRDVPKSEKKGEPHLLDLVITEPDAGTDVQEPLLLDRGRIGTIAKKVDGGYVINGRKIFISNGHFSYWHIVMCSEDKKNPAETFIQCVIPNGSKGFSFGTREKKMGHLASTASELLFEDCFVPNDWMSIVCQSPDMINSKKGIRWTVHSMIDYVVSSSRAGVGAIGTGIARGAYEAAMSYARKKNVGGELLVNQQWAQIILTDMYRNVNMGRAIYMESAYTDMLQGLFKLLAKKPIHYFLTLMPKWYFSLISPLLSLKLVTRLFRKYYYDWYTDEERDASSGWASIAKYTCTDIGVANANLALDLMGADGLRHDHGAEKCYRDVKLTQIYESTNQVNQMNLFCCLVGNHMPEVEFFK